MFANEKKPSLRYPEREKMVEKLWESLTEAWVDPTKFAGHSFRIGAASTARVNGVQDSMIQTLIGPVEECCLPTVCLYSSTGAGQHI